MFAALIVFSEFVCGVSDGSVSGGGGGGGGCVEGKGGLICWFVFASTKK